jgi:predicted HTH domain antitoxin
LVNYSQEESYYDYLNDSLPDSISSAEAQLLLAMKLFELGRLSCGKAAEVAGYSKRTFMELLGKNNIPVFDYPPNDLERELQNAQ